MADVFAYNKEVGEGIVAKAQLSTISIDGASPALIQGWSATYSQTISEIYEVGSAKVYWNVQPAVGGGNINRIVGGDADKGSIVQLTGTLFTACNGVQGTIAVKGSSCAGGKKKDAKLATISLQGLIATSIGFNGSAQGNQVTEDVSLKFSGMTVV